MMETNRTLIRTDKNGTRYYSFTCPCAKCNGRGYIDHYAHVLRSDLAEAVERI